MFYVNNLKCIIDSKNTCSVSNPTVWLKLVPIKVTSFILKTCIDHIPNALALNRKGINIGAIACHFCPTSIESSEHLLVGCVYVMNFVLGLEMV